MRVLRWLEENQRQQTSGGLPPGLATGHSPGEAARKVVVGFADPESYTLAGERVVTPAAERRGENEERMKKQKWVFSNQQKYGRRPRQETGRFTERIPVSNYIVVSPSLITTHSTSVEILPKEWLSADTNLHAPFEVNEGHLGIPKHIFMQVYSYASKCFCDLDVDSPLELDRISSLVLLVNPAHQTALNRRKDLTLSGHLSNADDELRLTAVLQSLPDGAKSSILWHHRRWVLNHFQPPVCDTPSAPDSLSCLSLSLHRFATELDVASIACETYPRNYHAWLHKSKVIEALTSSYQRSPNTETEAFFRDIESSGIKHIDMHIKDYSSMHYLCRVFDSTLKCGLKEQSRLDETKERPYQPVEHAKALLQVYPTYESLWYYLRMAILIERDLGIKVQDADINSLSWLPQSKDTTVETHRDAFARWEKLARL